MRDEIAERAAKLNAEGRELCAIFAKGRCTAERCCTPPEGGFAERWRPRVAGRYVRPNDMPEHGYLTRSAALAAARGFKADCAAMFACLHVSPQEADASVPALKG